MDEVLKPAGFWIRFGALIIDGILMWVAYFIYGFLSVFIPHMGFNLLQIFTIIIPTLYVTLFLSSSWQATPGKRLLKIFVINSVNGQRISPLSACSRYLVLQGLGICVGLLIVIGGSYDNNLPLKDRIDYTTLQSKAIHHETFAKYEQQQYFKLTMVKFPPVTPEDKQLMAPIQSKIDAQQELTDTDMNTIHKYALTHLASGKTMAIGLLGLLNALYLFAIAIMVGVTHEKTGLHDIICKTRAVRGMPDKIVYLPTASPSA